MEIAPYLSAIQALKGQTPGEKYKSLHSIAIQIIQNENEKKAFLESRFTSLVQPALLPFLRIIVGNKLKIKEFVIEALKSDDVAIVEQALRAKWFFNTKNDYICVDYFRDEIMPFVSLRTRRRIIKSLARYLDSSKADQFFTSFADLYGLDQTLPMIVACSDLFILNTVFMRRIQLPHKILRTLHLRNSQFVVRYLQLGNEKNEKNKEDRNIHKIDIIKYSKLLPIIVKDHAKDFFEICESLRSWYISEIKIGSTRAKILLRHLKYDVGSMTQRVELVFKMVPLKLISSQLKRHEFETIFENLFPKDEVDLSVYDMIDYLKYYPEEKKFPLLRDKYKLAYGKDIVDKPDIYHTEQFFRILPLDVKEEFGRKVSELHRGTSDYYEFGVVHLPPREAIPMLKERIAETGTAQKVNCIKTMITSCSYYDSKDDILEVLRFYHDQYKNEPAEVCFRVMGKLLQQFVFDELDKSCWRILMDLIQKFYVKGDLYNSSEYFYWRFFHDGLLFFFSECQKDPADDEAKQWLDKLIEMILDCYLEHNMKVDPLPFHYWNLSNPAEFKRHCLKKYLVTIPLLYPENHEVWTKFGNKLTLVSYLVKSIDDYDFTELCRRSMKKYKSGNTVGGKAMLKVQDYDWLTKFIFDLLKEGDSYTDSEDIRKYNDLKKSLKRHDLNLYKTFVDREIDCIKNLEVSAIMSLLKHNPSKILNKWKSYLNACREKLQYNKKSVRKFVKATKWYQDLPIKFVEQSLLEIKDVGSIAVLALLLDGEAFGRIVQSYIPGDEKIDVTNDDAKSQHRLIISLIKSMNHVNPPVSLEIMSAYCQGDYVHLACNTVRNVALRIPVDKVITFANRLMDNSIPIRKLGIELICRVSSYVDSGVLVSETNAWIRTKIAKILWKQFKQTPSSKTWQLLKSCIDGLTRDDEGIFRMLNQVDGVDKNFVSQYLRDLLKKIDELEDPARSKLVYSLMENLIDTTIVNFISDDVLVDILKKQFFECHHRFMLTAYLFYDPNKFDARLETLLDIVREKFKEYNKPHPKHPRHYPMNVKLHGFFDSISSSVLCADKTDMASKLINACVDLVSEKLKLYEDPHVFMYLYLVKDYIESPTPQQFGMKCVHTSRRLVEGLGSEMILNDIGNYVERMLSNGYVYPGRGLILRMMVIEGFSQVDERLAALIGTKLLAPQDVAKYDHRYDEFVKTWSSMKDPMVLAALNSIKNLAPYYEN